MQCFSSLVLEACCTACVWMFPWHIAFDPNERVVIRLDDGLIIWMRCVGPGEHLKHAGHGSRNRIEKHCTHTHTHTHTHKLYRLIMSHKDTVLKVECSGWVKESHSGMKVPCSLVVQQQWLLLYLLPDGSRVNNSAQTHHLIVHTSALQMDVSVTRCRVEKSSCLVMKALLKMLSAGYCPGSKCWTADHPTNIVIIFSVEVRRGKPFR